MLTGLQVSSLPCKYVFYGPEHNVKGGPHGIKWNIPRRDKAQDWMRKMGSFI